MRLLNVSMSSRIMCVVRSKEEHYTNAIDGAKVLLSWILLSTQIINGPRAFKVVAICEIRQRPIYYYNISVAACELMLLATDSRKSRK